MEERVRCCVARTAMTLPAFWGSLCQQCFHKQGTKLTLSGQTSLSLLLPSFSASADSLFWYGENNYHAIIQLRAEVLHTDGHHLDSEAALLEQTFLSSLPFPKHIIDAISQLSLQARKWRAHTILQTGVDRVLQSQCPRCSFSGGIANCLLSTVNNRKKRSKRSTSSRTFFWKQIVVAG